MAVVSASLRARTGVLAISGGALLWGTTGVVAHAVHVRTGLSGESTAFYRVFVAALVLAAARGPSLLRFLIGAGRPRVGRVSLLPFRAAEDAARGHVLGALVVAGASLGVSQGLYFVAVADAGVSLATLICIGAAPIAVSVATAVARRRRPSAGSLATVACALAGLALITTSTGAAPGAHPVAGVVAALGSGLTYAASTVLSGQFAGSADALTLTGATSIVASLTLLPAALISGASLPSDGVSLAGLAYLGIVPTVFAYWLFFGGLRTTSAEIAAVLTLLEPLGATVLAVVLLGETLTAFGWLGAMLLLGAVGALLARRPEPPVGPMG